MRRIFYRRDDDLYIDIEEIISVAKVMGEDTAEIIGKLSRGRFQVHDLRPNLIHIN